MLFVNKNPGVCLRALPMLIPVLVLLVSCLSVAAANDWSGYLNDKSVSSKPYGFLSSISITEATDKLKLVCHSPSVFTLYLARRIAKDYAEIKVSVDKLPALSLAIDATKDHYTISNQSDEFWKLIAQMSAGAILRVFADDHVLYEYSLTGFTRSYLDNCGWLHSADTYQRYLHEYQ